MTFPRIEYFEWLEGRPDAADHDLGTSDLRGRHDRPLLERVDPDRGGPSVERRLASIHDVDPDRVLVTAGASVATLIAMAAALDQGDRLLVERPGYEAHHATARGLGATVEGFDRRPDEGYRLSPDRVEAALGPDAAAVVATNRHNPRGRLADESTLEAVATAADRHGARLIVDEVYAPYVTAPAAEGPFGGVSACGIDGAVVTGSLTKFHGYGGLRIGWLIADEAFVDRARSVAGHVPTVSDPSRAYARAVLADPDRETTAARRFHDRNAALLSSFVDRRDDLAGPRFEDCSYAFLSHERASGSAVSAAAEEAGVLVVPGRFFGDDDRFRVSLGRSPERMEAALDALGDVLDGI